MKRLGACISHPLPAAATDTMLVRLAPCTSAGPGPGSKPAVACYECQLPSIPGKFQPKKAEQLGVKRGPLWGQLKAGKPAPGADGRMVQPHEVCFANAHAETGLTEWQSGQQLEVPS